MEAPSGLFFLCAIKRIDLKMACFLWCISLDGAAY